MSTLVRKDSLLTVLVLRNPQPQDLETFFSRVSYDDFEHVSMVPTLKADCVCI